MKEENKFQFDLKRGDLNNLNKEEVAEVVTALVAFGLSKGFSLFVEYLKNKYVSDALYENRDLITSDYFKGGFDMIETIEEFITEMKAFEIDSKKK